MSKNIKSVYRIKKEDLLNQDIVIVLYNDSRIESNVKGSVDEYTSSLDNGWHSLTSIAKDFDTIKKDVDSQNNPIHDQI